MAAQNRHKIANGILSFFVLACGITFCVLVACLNKVTLSERREDHHRGDGYDGDHHGARGVHDGDHRRHGAYDDEDFFPYFGDHDLYGMNWTFGFTFIIAGITAIISALVKTKGAYIIHMLFGIIALVVKGAMLIFAVFAFEALTILWVDRDNCETMGDTCMCSDYHVNNCPCHHLSRLYCMMIGVLSAGFIGWILTLVTIIIAGILGCKKQDQPGEVVRAPMPTTVVQLPPEKQPLPETGYLAQIHDNAKLVSNMEFQQGVFGK